MSKRKHEEQPLEEVEEVTEVPDSGAGVADFQVDAIRERARRQLRRGRLTQLNDRIAGGPRRPGEQEVTRSPFVLSMAFVILGLAIVSAVFYFLILRENESRRLENAMTALEKSSYNEAIGLFENFLLDYPTGDSSEKARIGLHTAHVRKFTDDKQFTVQSAVDAQEALELFFRECRDFPAFEQEHENLVRYARIITRAAATVAVEHKSQKALDAAKDAFARLDSLTVDGSLSTEVREDLRHLQDRAAAEILKDQRLGSAMEEIRKELANGDTLAALSRYQELIERFEVLRDDPGFQQVLVEIRAREMELIVAEDVGVEGFTSEASIGSRQALSVNLRTQANSDQVSQGRLVFGSGGDVVYALDSETGDPVWKRDIGGRAPFAPIQIEVATPALLLFHSTRSELMLVQQSSGELIWRQSVESGASGPPLVLNQQIYLTTEAGELWQVSAATGRAVRRVQFSQPVQGPPTVSRDGESLVIPGQAAFVYTLSRQPLECRAVSWLEFGEGSVGAPMITMGELFLLCENYSSDRSRLLALTMADDGSLVKRETQTVSGQIWDPCLLRGDQLYVPSTPQRVTAFRVSDRPDNDALSLIGTNQLPEAVFSSMFLVTGPGGNLWMASTALRRFQVTTQAVLLDEAVVEAGQNLYPMQVDDDSLLVSTNEPYSASVFFTRVNRNSMTGVWRTVLSTNLVAAGASSSGNSLTAVSDFGVVFRVPLDEIGQSRFYTKQQSKFSLPKGLKDPVGGLSLPDGRLAAWCGGKEPTVWTISSTGQLERRWLLPAAPETSPVALAGGLVVPMPGRLMLTGRRERTEDYQVSRELNAQATWKSLTPISDTQLVAVNSDNQLVQIEHRTEPRSHLAQVSVTPLDGAVDVAPAAGGDYLCIATADGRLVLMRSLALELVKEVELDQVVSQPLRVAGDRLFAEVGNNEIRVFELTDELRLAGTIASNGASLVDTPLSLPSGGFLAALSDGSVLRLNPRGLPEGEPVQLGQRIQSGPIAVGSSVVVLSADGSIYLVDDLVNN